ncbi:non-ribosomal peptide synthase/polyketide synthase [Aquimarina muelleri]|uniref:Non-ribosomal peptide synthetase n=1 Tax=Aquimarina muelleri TaxID=279356 RepID=A0A918JSS0_9FLAO|nr:non-ribosomal peptide synthase/polyketide synthase [Aquimarina muelleri]MCX2761149.1 non-ribosomal peptide synthase/polyketide synthase [Aquimarina muelleri]GGX08656.1 non-ribosomal peptide synthetase [Aquimarina muelleri]
MENELNQLKQYWTDRLSLIINKNYFPYSKNNTEDNTYNQKQYTFVLPEKTGNDIVSISGNSDQRLFMILLAAVNSLLFKYTNQKKSLLFSPIIRQKEEVDFINTLLPLYAEIGAENSFKELIIKMKDVIIDASQKQNYPVEKHLLKISGKTIKDQLVLDTGFILKNIHDENYLDTVRFQLLFSFERVEKEIQCSILYNDNKYKEETVKSLASHFAHWISVITDAIEKPISTLSILTDEEIVRFQSFNDTKTLYPSASTIVSLFEEQVQRTPDNEAIIYKDKKITYKSLDEQANQLANCLITKYNIEIGSIIGVMLNRSEKAMISILAIMKAGGTYLPIDPDYPKDRKKYIIDDADISVLITDTKQLEAVDFYTGKSFLIEDELGNLQTSDQKPKLDILPSSSAYIIYTSGSTGKPKGVVLRHISNVNMALDQIRQFSITENDHILQFASLSFDASIYEIFMALYTGAALVIADRETINDPAIFTQYIKEKEVSVVTLPPVYLSGLDSDELSFLRVMITAGEAANVEEAVKYSQFLEYYNAYGPTECAVCVSTYKVGVEDINRTSIPIGKPIANVKTYILDKYGQLVPEGIAGEICIAGVNLAKEYLNNEELTAAAFIENPYSEKEYEYLYKTGDLGKWLPDGNIEFLGRIDHQVKINGYRIEPEEINQSLLKHQSIISSIVVAKTGDQGQKYLCAYYTIKDQISETSIREYLVEILPDYMIPSFFIPLEELPLTVNGKIDKELLPLPSIDNEYVEPTNDQEIILVKIWEEVLGIKGIGIKNNFFKTGGDSIKIIQIVSRLIDYGFKLDMKDVFKYPTIEALSKQIKPISFVNSEQGTVEGEIKLAPVQKWFFEKHQTDRHHFNQDVMLYNANGFDEEALEITFRKLLAHHDALRILFKSEGEEIIAYNRGEVTDKLFKYEIFDLLDIDNFDSSIEAEVTKLHSSFSLSKGPLVHVGLFRTQKGDYLQIIVHHLVIDGISWRILLKDLQEIYAQAITNTKEIKLPLKTNSYKFWIDTLYKYIEKGINSNIIKYWDSISKIEVEPLPKDKIVNNRTFKDLATITVNLGNQETTQLLRQVNHAYNTEINDILLTALGISFSKWTKSNKLRINLEGHGREDIFEGIDISRTIGWFTTIFPVVINIEEEQDLSYTIRSVKENLRKIPNKGIEYGILKYLSDEKVETTNAEIAFNYLGQIDQDTTSEHFEVSSRKGGEYMSKDMETPYSIMIDGIIKNDQLVLNFNYHATEHYEDTITTLAKNYVENLKYIIKHCIERDNAIMTPSDYGASISIDELTTVQESVLAYGIKKDIKKIYNLSPMQKGLFFYFLRSKKSKTYSIQSFVDVEGKIDEVILEESLDRISKRYDVLRTNFIHENISNPIQFVYDERSLEFTSSDVSHFSKEEAEKQVNMLIKRDLDKGFDLEKEGLFRIQLIRTEKDKYKLIWNIHHIIMDGWCLSILYNDLFSTYLEVKEGREANLTEVTPFQEYIYWLEKQDNDAMLSFWKEYLTGYDKKALIPKDKIVIGEQSRRIDRKTIILEEEIVNKFSELSQKYQVTSNVLIQSIWGILLQKYNDTDDVVFGVVVSGRPTEIKGIEEMVGLFTNTVPLRIRNKSTNFETLVQEAQQEFLEIKEREYLPLVEIQGQVELKNELIDHIMMFENYPVDEALSNLEIDEQLGFKVSNHQTYEETDYDFYVTIIPGATYQVIFSYDQNVYESETIDRLGEHFQKILNTVLSQPEIDIKNIELNSEADKIQLELYNNTSIPYPSTDNIASLFEEQVAQHPEHIAISFDQVSLTYQTLNNKANQLAHALQSKGIGKEDIVAIYGERSLETTIAILGVIKSGGVYLPIDPAYPKGRIDHMLTDTGAQLMIVSGSHESPEDFMGTVLRLEEVEIANYSTTNIEAKIPSDQLCYIMYTSGSTGTPKGVQIMHRNVIRLVKSCTYINLDEQTRFLQTGAPVFDATTIEIWGSLLNGGSLYLIDNDSLLDAKKLGQKIKEYQINTMWLTSPLFNQLVNQDLTIFEPLRYLIVGGDALSPPHINSVREMFPNLQLFNGYGPTENTTFSTIYAITKTHDRNIPIGKPIANSTAYVLNTNHQIQPIGVFGELYVGGDGVARGYLNNKELTKERFIENPFQPTERLYKTGDVVRWLPEGVLEFAGRADQQVKVRGYRIELGEITHRLLEHEDIIEGIVITRTNEHNDKYLCSYYVGKNGEINAEELKSHMKESLPEYMVPSFYIHLEQIPLTTNGKVNKKALPEPTLQEEVTKGVNAIEEKLIQVWEEVLGIKNINTNTDFFNIGGDSIKSIQIVVRMAEYGYQLELDDVFAYNTITKLSQRIKEVTPKQIDQDLVEGQSPLTPIQEWFFENNHTKPNHFNQDVMLFRENGFDETVVYNSFKELILHHDILRANFVKQVDSNVLIEYTKDACSSFDIKVFDFRGHPEADIEKEANILQASLNIEKGPLIQLGIFRTDEGDHLLVIVHHLVIDGVSWRVLLEDFATLYEQILKSESPKLPLKTNSFKDWAIAIQEYAKGTRLQNELTYWNEVVNEHVTALPTDGTVQNNNYENIVSTSVELTVEETTDLLRNVNQSYHTEINDILLTALGLSIQNWSKSDRVLLHLEGHGRENLFKDIDVTRTIGWFTGLFPVLLKMPEINSDLVTAIKTIKEDLRKIPNKGVGYGIINYLSSHPLTACNPEIVFNYLGQIDQDIPIGLFKISDLSGGDSESKTTNNKYKLLINSWIVDKKLKISISYNTHQYNESTIESLSYSYKNYLADIISHCITVAIPEKTPSDYGVSLSLSEYDLVQEYIKNSEDNREVDDIYHLSPMQEGMLFHHLFDDSKQAYCIQSIFDLEGELDTTLFEKSINKLCERHEIFRTGFFNDGISHPVQIIFSDRVAPVHNISLIEEEPYDLEKRVATIIREDLERGFDIFKEPLMRVHLIQLSENRYKVIWNFHHILMDGWCLSLMYTDFFNIYISLKDNVHPDFKEIKPYRNYIDWFYKINKTEMLNFWDSYLKGYEEQSSIPVDYVNTTDKYQLGERRIILDETIIKQFDELSSQYNITKNIIIQALWGILLQKYNDTNDVLFGAVVSGRPSEIQGIEDMVGLFINTVPVRIQAGKVSFVELLQETQRQFLKVQSNEYIPLSEIQGLTKLKGDLFDHIMIFENFPIDQSLYNMDLDTRLGFSVSNYDSYEETHYNLYLSVLPGKHLEIIINYNENVYESSTIDQVCTHFKQITDVILQTPEILLNDIEIITPVEKQELLKGSFNDTEANYPYHQTIHGKFEEQALATPNHTAVSWEDEEITYEVLNQRANNLAEALTSKGVVSEDIVGVLLDRSTDMIVSILAILKVGAIYVPIDPEYPEARINYILQDSNASAIIVHSTTKHQTEHTKKELLLIEINKLELDKESTYKNEFDIAADQVAYVIYTSGTTGNPKGVMINHRNVIRLLFNDKFQYDFSDTDVWTLFHSYCFDFSVWEMYGALLRGGELVIVPKEISRDPSKFGNLLANKKVTVLNQTPSAFYNLIPEIIDNQKELFLRYVTFGGDVLKPALLKEFFLQYPNTKLINMYGITETTVHATYKEIGAYEIENNISNIGTPIPTLTMYIFDKNRKLTPKGCIGELYVGGPGVAKGYLNREELTKERFIQNPYNPEERLYRSGDLARMTTNGELEYIGRIDHQVKIRGFRIELGEVENELLAIDCIKKAVVIAKKDKQDQPFLCAYYISENEFSFQEFKGMLSATLPDHMIPSYFVWMQEFPLNSNEKIDRKALPDPEFKGSDYIAPSTKIEEILVSVWEEVLGAKQIGVGDNFFEIGGDSIKSIQIVSKLKAYGYNLVVKDVFEQPNIALLSKMVKETQKFEIDQGIVTGEVVISPIQNWFFDSYPTYYNQLSQHLLLFNEDSLDPELMKESIDIILQHHDILRTKYQKKGDIISQYIEESIDGQYNFTVFDYSKEAKEVQKEKIEEEVNRLLLSLNIETGPLVQIGIFKTAEGDHLFIGIHHLIIDGVSWRILLEDLNTLYDQLKTKSKAKLPSKTTSYKQWATELQKYGSGIDESYKDWHTSEIEYWKSIDVTKVNPLVKDHIITENTYKDVRSMEFTFSKKITTQILTTVHQAYKTEINDILLTVLGLALKKWAKEDTFLISMEGHGREDILEQTDITRTIGWFTSIFPVLLDMSHTSDISYQLRIIKETLRRIPEKGMNYGILKYGYQAEELENPIWSIQPEICFNYLGQIDQDVTLDNFRKSDIVLENFENFDLENLYALNINSIVENQQLSVNISYNEKEYNKESIIRFSQLFQEALEDVVFHCISREKVETTPHDYKTDITLGELDYVKQRVGTLTSGASLEKVYKLSSMQEAILFEHMYNQEAGAYIIQLAFDIKGDLDLDLWEKSFSILVNHYDILRTRFIYDNVTVPLQVVLSESSVGLQYHDITEEKGTEKIIADFMKSDNQQSFDLWADSLMRVTIFKTDVEVFKVVWSFHHILMDGWCTSIMYDNFFTIYKQLKSNNQPLLGTARPYQDYILWYEQQPKNKALDFWSNYLSDYEDIATLPKQSQSNVQEGYELRSERLTLNKDTLVQIEKIAVENNLTISIVLQVIWGALLQAYNNTDDVVFGVVVAGRPSEIEGIEEMLGLFINTLPVRIRKESNFLEMLQKTKKDLINARTYEHCSLVDIQSQTALKNNLLDHVIIFDNLPKETQDPSAKEHLGFILGNAKMYDHINYDFYIDVYLGDDVEIDFCYNSLVYDQRIIEQVKGHFLSITEKVAKNPEARIEDVTLIPEYQVQNLLNKHSYEDFAYEKTIQEEFELQAAQFPNKEAVIYGDGIGETLTYETLNSRANQLAQVLRDKGVTRNTIVGIYAGREISSIVVILGILKAGAAYVPLDKAYPAERINYTIEASGINTLIATSTLKEGMFYEGEVIELNSISWSQEIVPNLENINSPSDLAYVIFTSGTTGNPKGVMVEHKSFVHVSYVWRRDYGYEKVTPNLLQIAGFSFDIFMGDIGRSLLHGGSLVICPEDTRLDWEELYKLLQQRQITVFESTPALIIPFMQYVFENDLKLDSLNLLIIGSDIFRMEDLKEIANNFENQFRVINSYGVTEATVDTCFYEEPLALMNSNGNVPIGKPMPNMQMYVLDDTMNLLPEGTIGEMYIGGPGVARGYLNNKYPEEISILNQEKFVEDPFHKGNILYKTGDLVKWLPDGNLAFLGRKDFQVNIRGYRVEIGEIEDILLKYKTVKEVAVVAFTDASGGYYLAAYYSITNQEKEEVKSADDLRAFLSEQVPSFMVPAYFVELDKLPLAPSGKIDRKQLPKPDSSLLDDATYTEPSNKTEEVLASIWQAVLGIEKIGVTNDFFASGGDSIKAIQVASRLNQHGLKLTIRDLFIHPTIKELSPYIKEGVRILTEQGIVTGEVKLTPVQQWFFDHFDGYNHFNQSVMLYKANGFDENILDKVISQLVVQHDALRMRFDISSHNTQYNAGIEEKTYDFKVFDLTSQENPQSVIETRVQEVQKSLDISKGVVFAIALYKTSEGDHLQLVFHHLVIDGVSLRIIFEDLTTVYTQLENGEHIQLPQKTTSFKQWAQALDQYTHTSKALGNEREYWEKIVNTETAILPKDNEITDRYFDQSTEVSVSLTEEETSKLLKEVNQKFNTEINDILLSALGLTIKDWTDSDKIIINLEGHGREEIINTVDISRTVGWFTVDYPIILDMYKSDDMSYTIKSIKETLRNIPNKGIGYGLLKYMTEGGRKIFNKQPEISFNYLGDFDQDIKKSLFEISPITSGVDVDLKQKNEFVLDISGFIMEGKLKFSFDYSKEEYQKETIELLAQKYKMYLTSIIDFSLNNNQVEYSPTDYGATDITLDELGSIEDVIEGLEIEI